MREKEEEKWGREGIVSLSLLFPFLPLLPTPSFHLPLLPPPSPCSSSFALPPSLPSPSFSSHLQDSKDGPEIVHELVVYKNDYDMYELLIKLDKEGHYVGSVTYEGVRIGPPQFSIISLSGEAVPEFTLRVTCLSFHQFPSGCISPLVHPMNLSFGLKMKAKLSKGFLMVCL